MKPQNKIVVWVTIWATTLLGFVLSAYYSFPLTMLYLNSYPIASLSIYFWIFLSSFVGVSVCGGLLFRNMLVLSLASVSCIVAFNIYLCMYPVTAGPDAGFFFGITQSIRDSGGSLSSSAINYPWPGLFLFSVEFAALSHQPLTTVPLSVLIAFEVIIGIVLVKYCYDLTGSNARTVALAPALYFLAFRTLIDWQFAPQTMALLMLAIILLVVYGKRLSYRNQLAIFGIFTVSLVLLHPFFWSFFLAALLLGIIFLRKKIGVKNLGSETYAIITISGLAILYDAFLATTILHQIAKASQLPFQGLTELFSILSQDTTLATSAPAQAYVALTYSSSFVQLLILAAMAGAVLFRLARGGLKEYEYMVLLSVVGFLLLGSLGILAWRAIQVAGILGVGSFAYFVLKSKFSRVLVFILLIGVASIPISVARSSWYPYPQNLGIQGYTFSEFSLSHWTPSSYNNSEVLADKSVADFMRGYESYYWSSPEFVYYRGLAPKPGGPPCIGGFSAIVLTPQLWDEIQKGFHCQSALLDSTIRNLTATSDSVYSNYGGSLEVLMKP